MIEANYAALWGKEALAQIVSWKLAERTVAPLPLGIKRSLWDQLEFLLNPAIAPTASGKLPILPAFHAQRVGPSSPYDRYKVIPGLLKMAHIHKGKAKPVMNRRRPPRREREYRLAGRVCGSGEIGGRYARLWHVRENGPSTPRNIRW